MWSSELQFRALNPSCILSLKFVMDTKVKTKRWKICMDSETFRVGATIDNGKYTIVSPMLVAMSHWLFDNIAHEDARTTEDEMKWRQARKDFGDLFLRNEYWLCFENAKYAELTQIGQDWFLRYENSLLSFPVNIVSTASSSESNVNYRS